MVTALASGDREWAEVADRDMSLTFYERANT
jgi:hypothetical protein